MTEEQDKLISQIQNLINNNRKKWLRTTELADYLSISLSQVHTLKNEGILPFTKLSGTIYFKIEEIDKILDSNQEGII